MTNKQIQQARTMLKILSGIDIVESACIDFKPTGKTDAQISELLTEARAINAKIIKMYDSLLTGVGQERLSGVYDAANKAVEWQIEKYINKIK